MKTEQRDTRTMDEYDPLLAAYNNGDGDQTGCTTRQEYVCAFIWDWNSTNPRICYQCGEPEHTHR